MIITEEVKSSGSSSIDCEEKVNFASVCRGMFNTYEE